LIIVHAVATSVVYTGGKFSTGINNTGETGRCTLPVHLDLQISPRIFEKFETVLKILWGWGEIVSWKKPEAKDPVTLSL
jgi:hypothetical protein